MQHTWNKLKCLAAHLTVSFCSVIAILQAGGFLFASPDHIPRMTEHLKSRTKLNRRKSPGTQAVLLSPSPRPQSEHLVPGAGSQQCQREHHPQGCAAATGTLWQGWTCKMKVFIIYRKPPTKSTERTGLMPESHKPQSKNPISKHTLSVFPHTCPQV